MPVIYFNIWLTLFFIEFDDIYIFSIPMYHFKCFGITIYTDMTTAFIFPSSDNCGCKVIRFESW